MYSLYSYRYGIICYTFDYNICIYVWSWKKIVFDSEMEVLFLTVTKGVKYRMMLNLISEYIIQYRYLVLYCDAFYHSLKNIKV